MWNIKSNELIQAHGLRFIVEFDSKPATFTNVLHAWQNDTVFRSKYIDALANAPYSAFRWETPPVTINTMAQPFEFVLLDSPRLTRLPEPDAFVEHFRKSPEADVVEFPNLGGDAIMIAPCLKSLPSAYIHLASFVREAPVIQCHSLWQLVGEVMLKRVSLKPVWLSTAGAGVAWLHIRLDNQPKYYGFQPYRQFVK